MNMTIKDEGYSFVMNQCLTVGTYIFSIGSKAEGYKVHNYTITNELSVDEYGYPCIVLLDDEGRKIRERIELLVCGLHTHTHDFLTREEAEKKRENLLSITQ